MTEPGDEHRSPPPKIPPEASPQESAPAEDDEALPALPMGQKRRWPFAVVGLLVLVVAGAGLRRALRQPGFDPRRTPVGRALGMGVPTYLVLAHRATGPALVSQKPQAFPPDARSGLDPASAAALDTLLDTIGEASRNEPDPDDRRHDAFLVAVPTVNAALRTGKQPYFLDGDVYGANGRRLPLLFSFYVQHDVSLVADGQPERVVHLWRLDGLNMRKPYLGYTRPSMGAAIVSLDAVETELVRWVLPSLEANEPAELLDEDSRDGKLAWQQSLQLAAGTAIRQEIDTGKDPVVTDVGRLLAKRRRLLRSWKRDMSALGHLLYLPERLVPEADYEKDLAGRMGRGELADWTDLHDDLLDTKHLAAFERIRDAHAASVQRHEVQHRIDFRRDLRSMPPSVKVLLAVRDEMALAPTSLPARVRDEHSAYLANVATSQYPHTDLVLLSRFVFDKANWGDVYCYTSLTVLTDLATHLDLAPSQPLVEHRTIQRERASDLLQRILARSSEEIRDAARRAFLATHGEELPKVEQQAMVRAVPWRH